MQIRLSPYPRRACHAGLPNYHTVRLDDDIVPNTHLTVKLRPASNCRVAKSATAHTTARTYLNIVLNNNASHMPDPQ